MTLYQSIADIPFSDKLAITIGHFDGLHLGHQRLFALMKELAPDYTHAAVTFTCAPLSFIRPASFKGYLFPSGAKEKLLGHCCFDTVVSLDFPAVQNLTASEFLAQLLSRTRALHLFVGYNFRFGYGNQGDTAYLEKEAARLGFQLTVAHKVVKDGHTVSSSVIRELIEAGEVEEAGKLLGRPYFMSGIQEEGDRIGRQIGFPTVNLSPGRQIIPGPGVYLTYAAHKGRYWLAMSYSGKRPTLKGHSYRLETNFLEKPPDIEGFKPGDHHTILWVKKIRSEKKFHNLEELKNMLYNDGKNILMLQGEYPPQEIWKINDLEDYTNAHH